MLQQKRDRSSSWPAVALGIALALSPVVRFSWDIAPQTVLHFLFIPGLLLFITLRQVSFSLYREGPFLLFFAAATLSLIGAPEKATVRNELLVLLDGMAAAYLFGFLNDEQKRKLFLIPLLVALWFSVILFFNFAKNPALYVRGPDTIIDVLVNFNVIAGYLVLCLPLSFLFWEERSKDAVYYRLLSAALFAGILLTKSRTGIAVAAIAVAVYVLLNYREYRKYLNIVVPLIGAVILLLTVIKMKETPFIASRIIWWKAALGMFAAHPINGVGWGNFGNLYLAFRPEASLNTLYAHNIFLQILAETGIPGLLAFVFLVASIIRRYSVLPDTAVIKIPVALALGSSLVFNLFDYSFYIPAVQLLFWICIGALFTSFSVPRNGKPFIAATGLIAILPIAYLLLLPFLASVNFQNGLYYLKHSEPLDALAAFKRSAALDPLPSRTYSKTADTYFALHTASKTPAYLEQAILNETKALSRYPENARYWSDLSWLQFTSGEREKALSSIGNAVFYDRFNPDYRYTRKLLQESLVTPK